MNKLSYLLLALIPIFSCKPDEIQIKGIFHIRAVEAKKLQGQSYSYYQAPGVPDAEVVVFPTHEDFLLNTNPIAQGKTNADGWFQFQKDIPNRNTYFYYKVSKDTLSNLRSWTLPYYHGGGENKNEQLSFYYAPLSTTPTRLKLIVKENGSPLDKAAEVQLYWSEEDYENNVTPLASSLPDYYGNTYFGNTFKNYTNENGEVLFHNLEPRKYWFKIKSYKNNSTSIDTTHYTSTPHTTNGALENNPDITTVLTVNVHQ